MQYTKKQADKSYAKNASKLRLVQQTHHTSCNPSSSTKHHFQAKSDQKPTKAWGRFPKLTRRENQELLKNRACIYYRKVSHQDKDCPIKKNLIITAAGSIQQGPLPPTSTATNDISSAALARNISENLSPTSKTKRS